MPWIVRVSSSAVSTSYIALLDEIEEIDDAIIIRVDDVRAADRLECVLEERLETVYREVSRT